MNLIRNCVLQLVSIFSASALFSQCEQVITGYTPFETAYEGRMLVQVVQNEGMPKSDREVQISPKRVSWAYATTPNILGGPPLASTVYIGYRSRPARMKLFFSGIDESGVQVRWLNEKLLWGSVRWNERLSTDFIFDVESQAFLYREMANWKTECNVEFEL